MKLTIEHYVSTNNPNEAQKFLEKYKIPRGYNMSDLIDKVHYVTRKHKDFAFNELAQIDTPYRQLILSTVKPEIIEVKKEVVASNACGCSGADGTSNACGCSGADGEMSNCSGCGGTCGKAKTSGADGKTEQTKPTTPETKTEVKETSKIVEAGGGMKEYMPLAIVGLFVIGAIIVARQ